MSESQQSRKRNDWEDYYDSIGLSPAERTHHWLQKEGAKRAQTVADVACLIKGSYFEADFETEEGLHQWLYLNPDTLEVIITKDNPDGEG
jgi:hypothetical protein